MNVHGWAAALIVFLLASDPVQEGMSRKVITIRVVDAVHGTPLEGVAVHVAPKYPDLENPPKAQRATTGKDGRATIELSQLSFTRWRFRKTGYLVAIHDWDDLKGRKTVRLHAAPPLVGRVVRFGDGKAIANARVHQWAEAWGLQPTDRMLVTGADGTFHVPGLSPAKTVVFGVAAEGFASVVVPCPPDRREGPFVITLGQGGTMSGRVLDMQGDPLAGADVFLAERGGDDPLRKAMHVGGRYAWLVGALRIHATSGADGSFRFTGVPARSPHVVFARSADGREGRTGALTLKVPGDRMVAEVRVRRLAKISLFLFDAETEAEIDAHGYAATIDRRHGDGRRDQDASYDSKIRRRYFADVRPGTHIVYLSPKHHVKKRVAVTVTPGEHRELRVLLDRGTFFSGRLVNPKGRPLSAHVRLYWMDDGEKEYRSGMAGKDGRFELRGIPKKEMAFFAWPGGGGEGEWKVTTGRDIGDLVVGPAARVIVRLAGVEAGTRGVSGVVYASGGGNGSEFTFGKDGRYVFRDVVPGREFSVYLGVSGRAPFVRRGLSIEAGKRIDLGEVRPPEPCTVAGRVVDPAGKPVPSARVRVIEGWQESPAVTDRNGAFVLEEMPPGRSLLVVEVEGTPFAYLPVDAKPDMEAVTITLASPGTIVATVRDSEGSPVLRFPFNLFPHCADGTKDWNRRVIVRTDGRGEIRVPALPGRWFLEPHPNRRRELTKPCPPLDVTPGNETTVRLTLK